MKQNNKTNYHAHTYYCKHATNSAESLITLAITNGYTKFGISEHMPIPTNPSRSPNLEELQELINEVKVLKKRFQNQIEIYFGLECEYYWDGLEDLVKGYYANPDIDYLIFGNHFNGSCIEKNYFWNAAKDKAKAVQDYLAIAEYALKSGMFSAFNHPDIIIRDLGEWNDNAIQLTQGVIDLAIKYDTPIEFNLNGLAIKYNINKIRAHYGINNPNDWENISEEQITDTINEKYLSDPKKHLMYPHWQFWQMVKGTKAKINIGVDTHQAELMDEHYRRLALHLLNEWGLTPNLVDDLKLKSK